MDIITVLTCFSYSENKQYVFHPDYLRSDLRRLCDYCLNYVNCKYQNIYVLTDLVPNVGIQDEIRFGFQTQVENYLRRKGYLIPVIKNTSKYPLVWLKRCCQEIVKSKISWDKLYDKILRRILPIIQSSNSVEFASLFMKFYLINSKNIYDTILKQAFEKVQKNSKLIFYYTGHGIRHYHSIDGRVVQKDICLVIPTSGPNVEFYSRSELFQKFTQIMSRACSFLVFDCCYADSLMNLPFQKGFDPSGQIYTEIHGSQIQSYDTICLTSTSNDQTCGFYAGPEECGSVFTYYLIQCLQKIAHRARSTNFSQLYSEVEQKVSAYRILNNKTSQNMLIQLNKENIWELPSWLFRKSPKSGRKRSKKRY